MSLADPQRSNVRARVAGALHHRPRSREVVLRQMGPVLRARALNNHRSAARHHPWLSLRYLLRGKETGNLTYDIANAIEIVDALAVVLAIDASILHGYLTEAEQDRDLHQHLASLLTAHRGWADIPRFGRRLGWYVATRATKPRVLFETGTHDGLGSALLLRALELNTTEGHPGELYSFDINPLSGWLIDPKPAHWHRIIGDVQETLPAQLAHTSPEIFIHDSLHTVAHERFEFESVIAVASRPVILITDNAHVTSVLRDIATNRNAAYAEFMERPIGTWYPGCGLGLARI